MHKAHRPARTARPIFFGFLAILSFAQIPFMAACAATTPQQAQQAPEGKFIQDLGDKANGVMVDTTLTPAQLDAKYREMMDRSFDIDAINEFVIGRTWMQATPEQQREYLKLFKELMLRTYGRPLHFHKGEGLYVNSVSPQNEEDTIVSTEVMHPDGAPSTPVDWIVRRGNDSKLAIVDVIIDGNSQSATQRDKFASILASNGGDFNAILDTLRKQRASELE